VHPARPLALFAFALAFFALRLAPLALALAFFAFALVGSLTFCGA